jgi:hypothetical protein
VTLRVGTQINYFQQIVKIKVFLLKVKLVRSGTTNEKKIDNCEIELIERDIGCVGVRQIKYRTLYI